MNSLVTGCRASFAGLRVFLLKFLPAAECFTLGELEYPKSFSLGPRCLWVGEEPLNEGRDNQDNLISEFLQPHSL